MSHEFYPIRNRKLERIEIEPELRTHVIQEIEHDRQVYARFMPKKRRGWRLRERFYTERIYQAYVRPRKPLRVITLVREPVANNVSMFFEVFDHYAGTSAAESSLDVDQMIDLFLTRYMHWRPLTWFDAELKTTLGVDVFQQPFDCARGFAEIASDQVQLLVMKSELDDNSKARAIADFLGLDSFSIVRSNVSSNRSHATRYDEFKRRIRVPDWLLDEMYNSKYARHFYSPEERTRCRQRWGVK